MLQGYDVEVYSAVFANNSAPLGGAVALANGSSVTVNGAQFLQCEASMYGGAIYAWAPSVSVGATAGQRCPGTDSGTLCCVSWCRMLRPVGLCWQHDPDALWYCTEPLVRWVSMRPCLLHVNI